MNTNIDSGLYIVATPIGNLSDISPRAVAVLQSVDFIICEDTRVTSKLLSVLDIHTPLQSFHAHNEKLKTDSIIKALSDGKSCALVSDAGTPAISDPGSHLIDAAHAQGIKIFNVPGPSSIVCALAASGFNAKRHIFSGFLPREPQKQIEEFEIWKKSAPCIGLFLESPQRILGTLDNLKAHFNNELKVSFSREISKKFEENIQGSIQEIIDALQNKDKILGEFVCAAFIPELNSTPNLENTTTNALKELNTLVESTNISLKSACKYIAQKYNISPKELYTLSVKKS